MTFFCTMVIFADTFTELYKSIGLAHDISDDLLSLAGSISSVTNTLSRLVLGYAYD